jgi:hypothetical protein
MNKSLSENKIDEKLVSRVNDENARTDIQSLKKRAERGSREKFLKALSKVPKVESNEEDRLD